jgi:hypothetical protein
MVYLMRKNRKRRKALIEPRATKVYIFIDRNSR